MLFGCACNLRLSAEKMGLPLDEILQPTKRVEVHQMPQECVCVCVRVITIAVAEAEVVAAEKARVMSNC